MEKQEISLLGVIQLGQPKRPRIIEIETQLQKGKISMSKTDKKLAAIAAIKEALSAVTATQSNTENKTNEAIAKVKELRAELAKVMAE